MRILLIWLLRTAAVLVILLCVVLVFCRVLGGIRESETARHAAPRTGRFVRAYDTDLFIQEAGPVTGPKVLLIHGTGAWSEIWRDTIEPLSTAGFHAVAIDLPPFGYSGKPAGAATYSRENQARRIVGVLDALQMQHAILVGHSIGARPTLEAAFRVPGRIDRLVLIDPALGFQPNPSDAPHFVQNNPSWAVSGLFGFPTLRNAVLATYGAAPWSTKPLFRSFVSQKSAVTDDRVKMLQAPLAVENTINGYGDWMQYLLLSHDPSLGSDFKNLKKLAMPVQLIWGNLDNVTPLWQGEQLKKLIPNSELAIIDNTGHIPFLEDPRQFNAVLLKALSPDKR